MSSAARVREDWPGVSPRSVSSILETTRCRRCSETARKTELCCQYPHFLRAARRQLAKYHHYHASGSRETNDKDEVPSTAACAKPRAAPVSRARPASPTTLDLSDPPQAAQADRNLAAENAEVEAILDVKGKEKSLKYKVQWAGYDGQGLPWKPTWEPAACLENNTVLDEWLEARAKKD